MNNTQLPPLLSNYTLAANQPAPIEMFFKMQGSDGVISNSSLYSALTLTGVGIFLAQIASIGLMLFPPTLPVGAAIAAVAFHPISLGIEGLATAAGAAGGLETLARTQMGPDQTSTSIKIQDLGDVMIAVGSAIAAAKGLKALQYAGDAVDVAKLMKRVRHFFWGINAAVTRPRTIGIAAWQMTKLSNLTNFLNLPALYVVSARERAIIADARRGLEILEKMRRMLPANGGITEDEESALADELLNKAIRALMSSVGVEKSLGVGDIAPLELNRPLYFGDASSTSEPGPTKAAVHTGLGLTLLNALSQDVAAAHDDVKQMEEAFGSVVYDPAAASILASRAELLDDLFDSMSKIHLSTQNGETNYDVDTPPFSGDVSEGLKDLYNERTPWLSDRDIFSRGQTTSSSSASFWRVHPLADFTRGLALRIELLIAMGVVSPLTLRSLQHAPANSDFVNPDPLAFIRALTKADCHVLSRLNGFTPASALWAVDGGMSVLKASSHPAWTSGVAVPFFNEARSVYTLAIDEIPDADRCWPTFLSVIADPTNFMAKVLTILTAQAAVAKAAALAFAKLESSVNKTDPNGNASLREWLALMTPTTTPHRDHGILAFQGSGFISDETVKAYEKSFNLPLFERVRRQPGVAPTRVIEQFFKIGRWEDSPHKAAYVILDGTNPTMDPGTALAKSGALVGSASLTTVTSMSSYCRVPRFSINNRSMTTPDPSLVTRPGTSLVNLPGLRRSIIAKDSAGKSYTYSQWNKQSTALRDNSEVISAVSSHVTEMDQDTLSQEFGLDSAAKVYRLPLSALILTNAFASARVGLPYRRKDLTDPLPADRKDLEYVLYRHLFEDDSGAKAIDDITKGYKFLAGTSVWHHKTTKMIAINFPARGATPGRSDIATIPSTLLFPQSVLQEAASLDALTAIARSHDPKTMGVIRSEVTSKGWRAK